MVYTFCITETQKNDMISLNVGGIMYMTTRSTLTSHSSGPKSKLQAMFGHPATELCPLDAQGNFFIDRDGQLFRYVLNFLRTGRILKPSNKDELRALLLEADYYQIQSLSDEIRELETHR